MPPVAIPMPLSSFPGANPQESAGRLINCLAEQLGDPQQGGATAPRDGVVWRRLPGLTQFSLTTQTGYRGGIEAGGVSYEAFAGQAVTLTSGGVATNLGAFPGVDAISIAENQNETSPDVVAVDPIQGAYVLNSAILNASLTLLLAGTSNASDTVKIDFTNPAETLNGAAWPVTVTTAALGAAGTAIAAATALVTAINANAVLSAGNVSASNVAGTSATITIDQVGIIGNQTTVDNLVSTGSRITGTFTPTSGIMSGGAGVAGTFTGTPTFYNGQTNLPAVNSVSFQDGYFFFTTADGRVFASGLNSLTQNALTFGRIEAKADVTLLRGIAFSGYMFFFTSGSIEIWGDAANPAPAFPYGRQAILGYGLLQANAIAGFETGFDDLLWVAADFSVYLLQQNSQAPVQVSPPDLNRLIETQFRAGDTLRAGVHIYAGKKVWVLSSAKWTWEFHLDVQKWYERASLQSNGAIGQWRGVGGHLAFGKWLLGDTQSTAIHFIDVTNDADVLIQDPATWVSSAVHMLMRIESGIVDKFPVRTRVVRADFHFVRGVGTPVASRTLTVTGTAAGNGGVVRLAVVSTLGANTGDQATVGNVGGTVEANGTWPVTVIDGTHLEIPVPFVNNWTSGGTVADLQVSPNLLNPSVAISWSDDGGVFYRPPVIRNLGELSVIKTGRVAVKNAGMTGQIGRRWRLDVTAPVYTAFLKGTQSDLPGIPN